MFACLKKNIYLGLIFQLILFSNMKKFTFILLAAVSLLSACKKEEEQFNSPFKMIADKKWVLNSYLVNKMGVDVESISSIQECQRDNSWTLKADFNNVVDEESNKCEEKPQNKTSGTWELRNNSQDLYLKDFEVFNVGTSDATYKVIQLTDTKLGIQLKHNNVIHSFYFQIK